MKAYILVPVLITYSRTSDDTDIRVNSVETPSFEDCETAANEYAATEHEDKEDAFNELGGYY